MADDKILRMQQLVSELNEASDAYYNGLAERMTDYEWDAWFDELKRLVEKSPEQFTPLLVRELRLLLEN